MTNTDTVERLRELLGKATQVAWKTHEQHPECIIAPDGPFNWEIARCDDDAGYDALGGDVRDEANAALIVEAINALPALLDAVEALEPFAGYHTAGLTKCSDFSPPGLKVEHFDAATAALATLKGEG